MHQRNWATCHIFWIKDQFGLKWDIEAAAGYPLKGLPETRQPLSIHY